jgi:hypothetical protein
MLRNCRLTHLQSSSFGIIMAALQDSSLIQTLETDHMLIKIPAAQYRY